MAPNAMKPVKQAWGSYFPQLAAVVETNRDSLEIRGAAAVVRIESDDLRPWIDLLSRFDGRHSLEACMEAGELTRNDLEPLIERLAAGNLLLDAAEPWAMFHEVSSNPLGRNSAWSPTAAWTEESARERWSPPGDAVSRDIDPSLLSLPRNAGDPPGRLSFARERPPHPHPVASETIALQLAHAAYHRVDGCRRPVASAGGLDPIHLLTIGAQTANGSRRVLYLPDDGRSCQELCRLDLADIHEALVPDPVIEGVVAAGAALIMICVDPSNIVAKYGSRGWRYALMETGAVSHQIALQASSAGAHCRPVGGFVDERVANWTAGLIPLLMVVIAVEAGGRLDG
jgi:nitroreductase